MYLCNQCLSPLKLWVRISFRWGELDKVCQWLAAGRWFSPGTPVSSTNKTDRYEILFIVALNTITLTLNLKISFVDIKENIVLCLCLSFFIWWLQINKLVVKLFCLLISLSICKIVVEKKRYVQLTFQMLSTLSPVWRWQIKMFEIVSYNRSENNVNVTGNYRDFVVPTRQTSYVNSLLSLLT